MPNKNCHFYEKELKRMHDAKLKDAPLVRSALQIDIDEESPSLEELMPKEPVWQKLGPYIAGFMSFLIGLLLFVPIDDLALESMRKLNVGEGPPQADHISISIFGGFEVNNFVLNVPSKNNVHTPGDGKNLVKSNLIEGDISLLSFFLFDTLDAKINIKNFHLNFISDLLLSLKGERLQIIFEGKNLKNGITAGNGKLQLNGVDLLGNYDGIIPGVGEKLGNFIINNIIGEIQLKFGVLSIKDFYIESSLGKLKVSGTLGISNPARTNLILVIEPKGFIRKYAKNNIEVLLKSMGYLDDDGKIFYECHGGFSNCTFRKKSRP